MPSTYLTRTFSSPTNRKKFTLSMWVKLSGRGSGNNNALLVCGTSGGDEATISFGNDALTWTEYKPGSGTVAYLATNRQFRDYNSWYHLVFSWDTTLSTADDRMKIYVNGVQETSFSSRTNPSQNYDAHLNTNIVHEIGRQTWNSSGRFNGSMSHIHFCDGYTYQASDFGETDTTTGEWKINTSPSVSYGTNGFWILKDGNNLSGSTVQDQSGSSNNWTVGGGTLTNTEDCPSKVFCTMNPLMNYNNGSPSFSIGNNRVDGSGTAWMRTAGTLGARTGKFYYEALITTYYGDSRPIRLGWDSIDFINPGSDNYYSGFTISSDGYIRGGINGYGNYDPNGTSLGGSFTQGDYIGLAIDLDNDLIYCYKNGTVFSGTNGLDISSNTNCSIKKSHDFFVSPSMNFYSVNAGDNKVDFNFGNGSFGTTELTGTTYNDSQGNGVFKYQPPTNYLAWCTSNFNV